MSDNDIDTTAAPEGRDPRPRARFAVERVAPPGSSTRAVMRLARQVARDGVRFGEHLREVWRVARELEPADPEYRYWLHDHRPPVDRLIAQTDPLLAERIRTRVAVIVLPGSDDDVAHTVDTLVAQTFRGWTATVVGQAAGGTDSRVAGAPGADAATVLAAVAAEGERRDLVVVLEPGDRVEPDLVFNLVARAWDNPFVDLIHWDDDIVGHSSSLGDPRFRPSWSPEMLLSANYVGRSFAVRRDRLAAAGPPRLEHGDVAWWDFLLRLDLTAGRVERVPRVLAHLARRPATVLGEEGAAVVRDHLARVGRDGAVAPTPAGVRVTWALDDPPHVTVVIPTRHNRDMLTTCLPSLAKTDYPSFDVVIVDNGGRTPDNEAWYATASSGLDLAVRWWEGPFNYSAVNNWAAADARGDVLVFLNDDTELFDPGWLRELVGWVRQPGVGLVGVQLVDPDDLIQHGGVVLGMNGFADHLFAGARPGDDSIFGSTLWYRNSLSVTAACVAVERADFAAVGGFDERFRLCGSDVVLGFDMRFRGLRSVVTPFAGVRHLESATRGVHVEPEDFPASYWRYQKWLRGGDPYFSPNLSLLDRVPALRPKNEPSPLSVVAGALGRDFTVFRQRTSEAESLWLADLCRADEGLRGRVEAGHRAEAAPFDVRTVNWYIPDIDSPFYGGINTAFRMADHLARTHGVENRFVVMAAPNDAFLRSALAAAFPRLADAPIHFFDGGTGARLDGIPPADAAIATLWVTAYSVAHVPACAGASTSSRTSSRCSTRRAPTTPWPRSRTGSGCTACATRPGCWTSTGATTAVTATRSSRPSTRRCSMPRAGARSTTTGR